MARSIDDYSVQSLRAGDNPFTDDFCTHIMERYQLEIPDDKEFKNFKNCLERAFRHYETDVYLTSRKPSKTKTSEIYLYINTLSKQLNETLEKLSLGHRVELCRVTESFSLKDLDKVEMYLAQLQTISAIANKELKTPPKVGKNYHLYLFFRGIGEVYDKFRQHRENTKSIIKEEFCIDCSVQANIEFRIKGDIDNDIQRITKLLHPS